MPIAVGPGTVHADRPGFSPAWLTLAFLLLTLSLTTGLLAVYGVNVPFPLDPDGLAYHRIRESNRPTSPLQASVVVLILPVLAVEAAPVSLLVHVLALSLLYTVALERTLEHGKAVRVTALVGLLIALITPLPGAYSYASPFPQVITLWPSILVGTILFFSHPVVRVGFPVLAYTLPMVSMTLGRRHPPGGTDRSRPCRTSAAIPVLLASLMAGNVILVLTGAAPAQLIGLLGSWSVLIAGLLVWILLYRPSMKVLLVSRSTAGLESSPYTFPRPGLLVILLTAVMMFVTLSPWVDEAAESRATVHHAQHLILLAAGFLQGALVYQLARANRRRRGIGGSTARFVYVSNHLFNRRGVPGVATATGLLALWHIPYLWDAAVVNDLAHALEHISVIAAGVALALSWPLMRPSLQYALLLTSAFTMSVLTLSLWVAEAPVYSTYPLWQLQELGMYHFLLGTPFAIAVFGATARGLLRASVHREGTDGKGP